MRSLPGMKFCLFAGALICTTMMGAAEELFDFSSKDALKNWSNNQRSNILGISNEYAVHSDKSIHFLSPEFIDGMERWPSFEYNGPLGDWSEYDRLVVYSVNPNPATSFVMGLAISDSKKPVRQGFRTFLHLENAALTRGIIDLKKVAETIDLSDINVMHLYSSEIREGVDVFFSGFRLLKPGEELPLLSNQDVKNLWPLMKERDSQTKKELANGIKTIEFCKTTKYAQEFIGEFNKIKEEYAELLAKMNTECSYEDYKAAQLAFYNLPAKLRRLVSDITFIDNYHESKAESPVAAVGFAPASSQLSPDTASYNLTVSDDISVKIARREYESFQVAVLPLEGKLENVKVTVGELKSADGVIFPPENIQTPVIGFVEVKERTSFVTDYTGWYADPILEYMTSCAIEPGILQSFFVRMKAPSDQTPGEYSGLITVSAGDQILHKFNLSVTVLPFTMPPHSPIPTAFTFLKRQQVEKNWASQSFEYARFLAEYYIDFDSIYRMEAPEYDILSELAEAGRLVAFNLFNVYNNVNSEVADQDLEDLVERIRPCYEEIKRRGLLDYAYIYGFDERPPELFAQLEKVMARLKQEFPEVTTMTTAYDHSFGTDSIVKSVDAWCPLTPQYDPAMAEKARANGKKVWWYVCCMPFEPYANFFFENTPASARSLMGPQTIKFKPDGFLYYSMCQWWGNTYLADGPFTDWNGVSWQGHTDDEIAYHGDGLLVYPTSDGKLVPSIRLENIRDGLDDYAYYCIAQAMFEEHKKLNNPTVEQQVWLAKAGNLLEVPDSLVKDLRTYSLDPRDFNAYRDGLIELITTSTIQEVKPWGNAFGVNGIIE